MDVPFGDHLVRVVCCPEDRTCAREECNVPRMLDPSQAHASVPLICEECQIPLRIQCKEHVCAERGPVLLPAALPNDMMVFYAPRELYEDGGLTVMEMICASTCITAMICFSMEVKYGHMLDSTVHMHRHRVGARGNATTFLLPWESVLTEMQRLDEQAADEGHAPDLPRTGSQLRYVVQVLLKTNDEDKREDLKHFVHQAKVNRAKVIRCILGMKARGHRAYIHVDEAKVVEKAKQLPEDGIPPELISLLPNENAYEKMRAQKAATPVDGMKTSPTVGAGFREERPNAVVMERSSMEEGDIQLRRHASIRTLVNQRLGHGSDDRESQLPIEQQSADNARFLCALTTNKIMEIAACFLDPRSLRMCLQTSRSAGHWCTPTGGTTGDADSARETLRNLHGTSSAHMDRFVVASGSKMEKQFVPWYFGVAFAFLFKFCT